MARHSSKQPWYKLSKGLAAALAALPLTAVARQVLEAVKLATYGAIPARDFAPISPAAIARTTRRSPRSVRRDLDALLEAQILAEPAVPEGVALARGERYLGIQREHTEHWSWKSPTATGKRHARKPREVQLDLVGASLGASPEADAPVRGMRTPLSAEADAPVREPRHKSEPVPTYGLAKNRKNPDEKTDAVGVVPTAAARTPVRNDSGSLRAPPTTTTTLPGPIFAGLYETEPLRRAAEARLRSTVGDRLARDGERYVRSEIARVGPEKAAAFVNGLLKDAARLREGALVEESRRCEAIAKSQRPEDDGPQGGGAPRVARSSVSGGGPAGSPVAAVTILEKGANGCVREAVAFGGRVDPFAFLASVGVEIGARLGGAAPAEAPVGAGRAA